MRRTEKASDESLVKIRQAIPRDGLWKSRFFGGRRCILPIQRHGHALKRCSNSLSFYRIQTFQQLFFSRRNNGYFLIDKLIPGSVVRQTATRVSPGTSRRSPRACDQCLTHICYTTRRHLNPVCDLGLTQIVRS